MPIPPDVKSGISRPAAESLEALTPILAEYTEALGLPVRIEVPHGRISRPRARRAWTLHLFAVPGRAGWLGLGPEVRPVTMTTVGGHPLSPGRRRAWAVVGRNRWGRPLQDIEEQTVGLLLGTDLYLLFDVLGQEPSIARLVTRVVLDLSLETGFSLLLLLTGLGPATLEARLQRLRQASELEGLGASARRRPCDLGAGETPGAEALAEEIRELEEYLRASGRQMRDLERRLMAAQCRLATLEGHRATPDTVGGEFDRIARLPGVTEAWMDEGAVQVLTEPIMIDYGLRRYRLGRFRLMLHFDGRLFLRNLTDRYETYDHPHIENERPCLGNIQEWIQRLLAQREFAAATEVLLQYLRTVNPADWRKAVVYWPEEAR